MVKEDLAKNIMAWIREGSAPPTQLTITPTYYCNSQCLSCWRHGKEPDFLSREPVEMREKRLLELIEEAKEAKVSCIELMGGGEPLFRRDTAEKMIRKIKEAALQGWLTTNGTMFTPDLIRHMVESGWDKITFSIDGHDEELGDFLRPPKGNFQKATDAVRLFTKIKNELGAKKPELTFSTVISKHNVDVLDKITLLACDCGVQRITFEPIKILAENCKSMTLDFEKEHEKVIAALSKANELALKKGITTNADSLLSSPELIKYSGKVMDNLQPATQALDADHALLKTPCLEPWFHIFLDPYGVARPCCISANMNENVNESSLQDIWFGKTFRFYRKAILSGKYPPECNNCSANMICFSREIQDLVRESLKSLPTKPAENKGKKSSFAAHFSFPFSFLFKKR
ncbi:radical SAM protein [Candidatus Woesearchaeota archaeon]|nr:radical SAM protein [Candidatus Woesearchaeota archaeon]